MAKGARARDRSIRAGLVKMVAVKVVCPHWNVRAAERAWVAPVAALQVPRLRRIRAWARASAPGRKVHQVHTSVRRVQAPAVSVLRARAQPTRATSASHRKAAAQTSVTSHRVAAGRTHRVPAGRQRRPTPHKLAASVSGTCPRAAGRQLRPTAHKAVTRASVTRRRVAGRQRRHIPHKAVARASVMPRRVVASRQRKRMPRNAVARASAPPRKAAAARHPSPTPGKTVAHRCRMSKSRLRPGSTQRRGAKHRTTGRGILASLRHEMRDAGCGGHRCGYERPRGARPLSRRCRPIHRTSVDRPIPDLTRSLIAFARSSEPSERPRPQIPS